MGNTVFYKDVATSKRDLTWGEILSETKVKHTKAELEYAMTSGMAINTATEEDMLVKWHRPWVFKKLAVFGISSVLFLYMVYIILAAIDALVPAIIILSMVVPPIVIPLSVMVFLWELNIPKNISFIEILSVFFIGGVLSLMVSLFFFTYFIPAILYGDAVNAAWNAPFAEEPGKLIVSLIFLFIYSSISKKKIYGLTGLVVGAAVGAGFAAFESIQYVFANTEDLGSSITISIIRMVGAFGAHTLWCSIYSAAFALGCKESKRFSFKGFCNGLFWLCFMFAFFTHMFGNMNLIGWLPLESMDDITIIIVLVIQEVLFAVLEWFVFLKVIKKCLAQAVYAGTYYSGMGRSYDTEIRMAMGQKPAGNVMGQPQFNNQPMGQPQFNNQPMGRPQFNNQPMGQPQFNNQPMSQPQFNNQPMGQPQFSNQSMSQPQTDRSPVSGSPQFDARQPQVHGQQPQFNSAPVHSYVYEAPSVSIMCTKGVLNGQTWNTSGKMSFIFGRGTGSDVKFPADVPSISRSHCKLYFANGGWSVADLNSKNGTTVNGTILAPGTEQKVSGSVTITLSKSEETFIFNC